MDSIKNELKDSKKDIEEWKASIENKITQNEFKDTREEPPENDSIISKKIKSIEADIAKMMMPSGANGGPRTAHNPVASRGGGNDVMSQTVVFEGFDQGEDGEEELEWLTGKLNDMRKAPLEAVYCKRDEFSRIIYARFETAEVASVTIEMVCKSKPEYKGRRIR